MSILAVLLVSQLAAAQAEPTMGVVLTRREGVTKNQAQALLEAAVDVLTKAGLPVAKTPMDGTSCAAKKPCLVALARKQGFEALITVEAANVLDEGVMRTEALSVDEDGKRLGLGEYEGPLNKKDGPAAAFAKLIKPLKALSSAKPTVAEPTLPPPAEVKPAEPVVVAPVQPTAVTTPAVTPTPAPTPTVTTPVEAPRVGLSGQAAAGIVLLGVGGVAGIVAGVFGAQASSEAGKVDALCPIRNQCSNLAAATTFYDNAERSQTIGLALAIGAGAAGVAGLVLLLTQPAPAAAPKVSFFVTPSSAGAAVSARW